MSKKVVNKNDTDWDNFQEVIDTPETEIIEENFFIEETSIKNKELIRMDMNIVQFPIFSKNTKRKVNQIVKYYFNKNRDTYITVKPSAGNYIPGEMEEKVFIALMQIMKEKNMPKKFLITSTELRDKLKITYTSSYGPMIKNSLLRLAETNYNFKNTLYSSEKKGVLNEEISTPIMTLRVLTLSHKENKKYRLQYSDKRIKEVYEITITDHFYNNIIQKGYMVYNSGVLLDISTSTARTIYMMIEKFRFYEVYLKLDTVFLIKRIPLRYDKKNLNSTIKTLEKAFNELKNKNLIKDFNILKETTWEKSEIEIFFYDESKDEKQNRFFEDRNQFRKMLSDNSVSDTEHKMIEDIEILQEEENLNLLPKKNIVVTLEMIDKILGLMPSKARSLKTMPKTIKDAISEYGYEKVEAVAIYMKKNRVEKVRAYFIKALENDWVEDEAFIVENPKKHISEPFENFSNAEELSQSFHSELKYFNSLSDGERDDLESKVYKEYIKECGEETKIQKLAFKAAKNRLIGEYISKNKLMEKIETKIETEVERKVEEKKSTKEKDIDLSIIDDINYYNDYISANIELYKVVLNLSEERIREVKKDVLLELGAKIISKNITLEEINKTIGEKLK